MGDYIHVADVECYMCGHTYEITWKNIERDEYGDGYYVICEECEWPISIPEDMAQFLYETIWYC